jgi:EmrB/QacA subfamily drug resistance transporter
MKPQSHKWLVILALLLGTFTIILNTSLLNPAIPYLAGLYGVHSMNASWIINIYVLISGLTLPLTGYVSERFGTKNIYLAGLAVFLLGSVLAACAWSMPVLIACRGLQGLGAGLAMPLVIALIFEVFPVHQRGLAAGIWGVVSMIAPTIGPAVGGLIVDHGSPKLLFLVNLPVGLLGLVAAWRFVRPSPRHAGMPFDKRGFVLIAAGVGLTLYALGTLNTMENVYNPYNWLMLGLGLLGIVLFIIRQRGRAQPLLELALLRIRLYRISTIVSTLLSVGFYASFFLIPMLMQQVYAYSATATGLLFIPDALMTGIFMMIGGRILDKKGARGVVAAGLLLVGVTTLLLGILSMDTPFWYIVLVMSIRGAGFGLSSIPATTAGMSALPESKTVHGSVLNDLVEETVSSFAIVVCFLVIQMRLPLAEAAHAGAAPALQLQTINGLFVALGLATLAVLPFWWRSFRREGELEKA